MILLIFILDGCVTGSSVSKTTGASLSIVLPEILRLAPSSQSINDDIKTEVMCLSFLELLLYFVPSSLPTSVKGCADEFHLVNPVKFFL